MRLFVLNCLLLASVAVALPNGRQKRHLSYLKNLVTAAISGGTQINIQPPPILQEQNGYKLFKLPGFEDVMIKVAPKKPVVGEFAYPAAQPVNLNAFRKVVGTKSSDDTLVAVKGVNDLLSTGILYGGHNNVMKNTILPMFSTLNTANYMVEENLNTAPAMETRPVITKVIETKPAFTEVIETKPALTEVIETEPALTEVIETRPVFTHVRESRPVFTEVMEARPILTEVMEARPDLTEVIESRPVFTEIRETRPVLTELIRPLEEKMELTVPFQPTYSYKQIQNDDSVLTFTAHNNPRVEVIESVKMKTELPMCIKKRVDEAIVLGADPKRFSPVQEVIQYQTPSVVDFSYPRVEPYAQNSFREEVLTKGFGTVANFGSTYPRLTFKKDSIGRYNLKPTKTQPINPHPLPLHSHKSIHLEENISATKDKANSQTKKVQAFTNLGNKVNISQTLGPIPPQYIRHVGSKGVNVAVSNKTMTQQMKAIPLAASKDSVSNAKIPNNVYKFQRNPNTGKVVKVSNDSRTNLKTNPNHYVIAPTVNREAPKKDTVPVKHVVFTNKITAKPQSVPTPAPVAGTDAAKLNLLRENVQPPFKNNPIILEAVKDYSYHQKNADGSSLNVKGNKRGVSVDIKHKNNVGRGDIPD